MGHFIRAECNRLNYKVSMVCSINDYEQTRECPNDFNKMCTTAKSTSSPKKGEKKILDIAYQKVSKVKVLKFGIHILARKMALLIFFN